MSREELRKLGLTDEQIEKVMAENGKDVQAERQKAEELKKDALKVNELMEQIKDLKADKANADKDIEGKNTELDSLTKKFEQLQADIKKKDLKVSLAEKGITGENADKLIEGLSQGNLDVETLGVILTANAQSAVDAKVKELEGNALNPNGGKAGSEPEKSEAEIMATNIGKTFASQNKASEDVLAQYI